MPARQRYDAPHEQLRDLALEAKRQGIAFEFFWDRAVRPGQSPIVTTETVRTNPAPIGAVVWPKDSSDRAVALSAIRGTKEGWRRAYDGEPETAGDRALSALAALAVEAAGGTSVGEALPLAA